jgi:molybdopterin molybdotransferase
MVLSVTEAHRRILTGLPVMDPEEVVIDNAVGRFLVEPACARRTLPPWDNSAMDGFAVRAAELPATLPVSGTVVAGDDPGANVDSGSVVRIMTGAPMPAGADAVVMREEVDDHGDSATFAKRATLGQHIRGAGNDCARGDEVVGAGLPLGPGEIGMLAAQGYARIAVARRPRVAILSTGDELVPVTVEPGPGQIVNSSAYALAVQVREAGGEPVDLGIAVDDREATVAKLREGLTADVLVTAGGVSVGDYDFVKEAFAEVGVDVDFWRVAMKPGKPLVFGHSQVGNPVFGLPGNPVSSMVGFELFVRPVIRAMQGARVVERPRVDVVLQVGYDKRPGRAHYVRATVRRNGDVLEATPHCKQGSGTLSSMVGVDALVIVDRESGDVAAGSRHPALLLRQV